MATGSASAGGVNRAKLKEIAETLEIAVQRKKFRAFDFFKPYAKQQSFFDMGCGKRERLFMAGNQVGKSSAGAFEMACHLTGEYPDWWLGRRFDEPIRAWAAGESSVVVRDVQQEKLIGTPGVDEEFGSGLIPKHLLVGKPSLARGVTDALDTVHVRHKSGGVSALTFKSYEQGRTKFQGGTIHVIWLDEEPDEEIYTECLARITATDGMVFTTFTPLKGMSAVVRKFLQTPSDDRGFVKMTIDEALHISTEQKAKIIAGYPSYQIKARTLGEPLLGSGAVFPIDENSIKEPAITDLPPHWFKLWGIDFGIAHPFAAVLGAWDKDSDVIHILHCLKLADQTPLQHAAAMRPIAAGVPVVWPQDGTAREKGSGEPLASVYRRHGLLMCPDHATFDDGSVSTEAGVMEIYERMTTGRFKVASHLSEWFEEFRGYHRKDGQIVKVYDDLMSATRIMVMAKRMARQVALGGTAPRRRMAGIARDVDFDVFG